MSAQVAARRRVLRRPEAPARLRHALRGSFSDDRGLGLPELLVTMMLVALMSLLVTTLFVTMSRALSDDKMAHSSSSAAAIGMNEMSRVIRGGAEIRRSGLQPLPTFSRATATSLEMTSFVDAASSTLAPVKVAFVLGADGVLTTSRWQATAGTAPYWKFSDQATSRVIARDVVAPTAETPLFRYLGTDGKPVTGSCTGSTATSCGLIRSVEVSFQVQTDPSGDVRPVRLQNTIGMPNLSQTIKDKTTP